MIETLKDQIYPNDSDKIMECLPNMRPGAVYYSGILDSWESYMFVSEGSRNLHMRFFFLCGSFLKSLLHNIASVLCLGLSATSHVEL